MEDLTKAQSPEHFPYLVQSVSVVVTAEFHNPSILHPHFLSAKKIVPEEWKVEEAFTTPPLSVVRFDNGINWTVDQSRLIVTQPSESSFQEGYPVYSLVKTYLEKLPLVPYRNLGLNCVVFRKQANPEQWITLRFLKSGPWHEEGAKVMHMMPTFSLDAGDAVCNLKFRAGQIKSPQGNPESAVIIDSNVHYPGPLNLEKLLLAIDKWSEKQDFVIAALDMLWKQSQK